MKYSNERRIMKIKSNVRVFGFKISKTWTNAKRHPTPICILLRHVNRYIDFKDVSLCGLCGLI